MKRLTEYIYKCCPCPGKTLEEFAGGQEITPELIDNWLDMSNRGSKGDIYGITQERIYESILHSYSPEKLEKEIEKNFPQIFHVDASREVLTSRMKAVGFGIPFHKIGDYDAVLSSEKFLSLLNQYNYTLTQHTPKERNGHKWMEIVLEPNIPDDRTTEVYIKYDGIVYHITRKSYVESILKNGLRLKNGSGYRYFDDRIFLVADRGKMDIWDVVEEIRNQLGIRPADLAVIKVDLKKNPRKIRLFDDPMMDIEFGLPLYTKEYISPLCLTDISSQFD